MSQSFVTDNVRLQCGYVLLDEIAVNLMKRGYILDGPRPRVEGWEIHR